MSFQVCYGTYHHLMWYPWNFGVQLEEKCRVEMEGHKQMLDKEYETLLTSFRKELEKLHVKHQQELERKVTTYLILGASSFSTSLVPCS